MATEVTCELDGFVMRGEIGDELAASAIAPRLMPTSSMKLSRGDILAKVRAKVERSD